MTGSLHGSGNVIGDLRLSDIAHGSGQPSSDHAVASFQ
jgi:hypothetical protein